MVEFRSSRGRKSFDVYDEPAQNRKLRTLAQEAEIQPGLVMRGRFSGSQGGLVSLLGLDTLRDGQVNSAKAVRSAPFRHEG